jgi:hypothetical protein
MSVHVRQTSMARFIVAVLATLLAVVSAKPAINPQAQCTEVIGAQADTCPAATGKAESLSTRFSCLIHTEHHISHR